MKGITNCECSCQHDIHEMTHYPRKNFKAKPKIPEGTEVEIIKEWNNFYGIYYRVVYDGKEYDIKRGEITLI